MVGLNDLEDLLQPGQLYDSVIRVAFISVLIEAVHREPFCDVHEIAVVSVMFSEQ